MICVTLTEKYWQNFMPTSIPSQLHNNTSRIHLKKYINDRIQPSSSLYVENSHDPTNILRNYSADVPKSIHIIRMQLKWSSKTNSLWGSRLCQTSQQHVQRQRYPFGSRISLVNITLLFNCRPTHCNVLPGQGASISIRSLRQLNTQTWIIVRHELASVILVLKQTGPWLDHYTNDMLTRELTMNNMNTKNNW